MEYAIGIGVTLIFCALYLLGRRKPAPEFFDRIEDDGFELAATAYLSSLSAPERGRETNAAPLKRRIKSGLRRISRKRYGDSFACFLQNKDVIKARIKRGYPELSSLPSMDGTPRAVLLCKFALARNGFDFAPERLLKLMDIQNSIRTLSFKEICAMKVAAEYVLEEALAGLFCKLEALAKAHDIAERYVRAPAFLPKKYGELTKSKLFLSICAIYIGYRSEFYGNMYDDVRDKLLSELSSILSSYEKIATFDPSEMYSPLEVLDKFDVFGYADSDTKRRFLTLLSELADKENLDEYLLVLRLEAYMQSASTGHMSVKRFEIFNRGIFVLSHKKDLTMLATALSSSYFMDVYFKTDNRRPKGKSISKIVGFENSFEPIYKFQTVNFGISAINDKLRINPRLPSDVLSADVEFLHNDVRHTLHIVRGKERALYVEDRLVRGVDLCLRNTPLEITATVPYESSE